MKNVQNLHKKTCPHSQKWSCTHQRHPKQVQWSLDHSLILEKPRQHCNHYARPSLQHHQLYSDNIRASRFPPWKDVQSNSVHSSQSHQTWPLHYFDRSHNLSYQKHLPKSIVTRMATSAVNKKTFSKKKS